MLGGKCNYCCLGDCPVCTGPTCCGDKWPRQSGECCDGVWRTDEGVCCGGQWYPAGTAGECCGDVWRTDEGVCCGGVWRTGAGECCGGVWRTGEGECCGGVWYPTDNPCPEGQVYLRWGALDNCCGCVPEQIIDPRTGQSVSVEDVTDELCCDGCGGPLYLPYKDVLEDSQGVIYVGCNGRCCTNGECTEVSQSECDAIGGEYLVGCCSQGCPIPCCSENDDGLVQCEQIPSGLCVSPYVPANPSDCASGCLGECCIDGVSQGQTTQADCHSLGGDWGGLGSTECSSTAKCRAPFTEACCETKQSSAAGLTFTQPRFKRTPPFSGTLRVTVTGTTDSAILIHGTPWGKTEDPPVRCQIYHTFLLCWDEFHIEPFPCETNFHNLDVEVCWSQESTDTETLVFSGCNGLTITLGDCSRGCATTLTYIRSGHTSDSNLSLRGNAVIEADGLGPLILTGAITADAPCVETLTLIGDSTNANEIVSAIPNSAADLSVIKGGFGSWKLSGNSSYAGQLKVEMGTLVVGTNVADSGISPFGTATLTASLPILGGTAYELGGTAALLVEAGFAIERGFSVAALGVGSTQVAVIGVTGTGLSTIGTLGTELRLGRSVTLQASDAATAVFAGLWKDSNGNDNPAVGYTIGSQGNAGLVVLESELSGSATGVSIVNGTLRLQTTTDNRINPATPVTIGSSFGTAALDLNGQSQALASITFTGSSNTITGGTLRLANSPTVSVTGTGHAISSLVALDGTATFSGSGGLTISGVMSGTNGIAKSGTGTLTLSAANTYTGSTTISEGTIALSGSLSASSAISIGDATLSCSGGTKNANSVTCTGAATISGAMTIGTLSGSGSLTKSGTGTMTLTNASTLSGSLSVSGGSLVVNAIVSGPALVTSATFTPSSLTVAFSSDPAQGNQFKLLTGSTVQTYSTVTLTGTTKTGTYDSATSTLTIN